MMRDNKHLVPYFLGAGAACTATYLAYSALQRRSCAKYGGLDGLVSFSSRLIAASRAVESQQEEPFIVDPLAAVLAGPEALARKAAYASNTSSSNTGSTPPAAANGEAAQEEASQVQQQGKQGKQQTRPVPRIIMRTCFMDDAVLAATGAARPAAFAKTLQQLAKAARCTQVVLLGSGMDTRPWRLALPPGIAWFEVDRLDVLTAKQQELAAAGVQLVGQGNADIPPTTASAAPRVKKNGKEYAHPLKASSWAAVAVDLQVPGWSRPLVVAGFNPAEPTVWVAEGLMYYLEPNTVAPLLQEMAAVSAAGSVLACNFLTASGLAGMRSRRQAAAAAASSSSPPSAPSSPARAPGATTAAAAAGVPVNARAAAAAGVEGSKAGLLSGLRWVAGGWLFSKSSSSQEGPTLTEQFKWGCPDNVQQFLDFCSWRLLDRYSWTQAARAYGWEPDYTGATVKDPSQEVQFVTATVKVPWGQ